MDRDDVGGLFDLWVIITAVVLFLGLISFFVLAGLYAYDYSLCTNICNWLGTPMISNTLTFAALGYLVLGGIFFLLRLPDERPSSGSPRPDWGWGMNEAMRKSRERQEEEMRRRRGR